MVMKIKSIEIERDTKKEKIKESEKKLSVMVKIGLLGNYIFELKKNKKLNEIEPDYKIEMFNDGLTLLIYENKEEDQYNCILDLGFLGKHVIDCKNVNLIKRSKVEKLKGFPGVQYYGEDITGTLAVYIKTI